MIKEGVDPKLDHLISMTRDGKKWIAALEDRERKRTGINSLKVGLIKVFGLSIIEVTKANAGLVPDDYIRKQTLVNAERYINQELKGYEYTVFERGGPAETEGIRSVYRHQKKASQGTSEESRPQHRKSRIWMPSLPWRKWPNDTIIVVPWWTMKMRLKSLRAGIPWSKGCLCRPASSQMT